MNVEVTLGEGEMLDEEFLEKVSGDHNVDWDVDSLWITATVAVPLQDLLYLESMDDFNDYVDGKLGGYSLTDVSYSLNREVTRLWLENSSVEDEDVVHVLVRGAVDPSEW